MRKELFYKPMLFLERVGQWATESSRLKRLKHTPADGLNVYHIDSLELLDLLKPLNPRVIFDVGANVGTWTLLAKTIFPTARVHAFEPLPLHADKFLRTTGRLEDVFLHTIALGSSVGQSTLKVNSFSDTSSILPLTTAGKSQWNLDTVDKLQIEITTIDHLLAVGQVLQPDVIKLDIQGFELEALKGAIECLPKVAAVITELSFAQFYEDQCLFHDVVTFLGANGLTLNALGHSTPTGSTLVQADALFTRVIR
jgi:FkbM family methyltransferase